MTAGIAANGSRVAYYFAPETAGSIGTTPEFKPIRFTGGGLSSSVNELKSAELRSDRHVATSRRGATTVGGTLNCEMSFGSYDDLLQAALCGAWASDALITGTTRRKFSILRRYLDINNNTLFTGCEVSEIKLDCPLQAAAKLDITFVGLDEVTGYTIPVGATFDAPTTSDMITTFDGSMSADGTAINWATALNVSLNNNAAAKYSLFNRAAYSTKFGQIDVNGQLTGYIEDDSLKVKAQSELDSVLVVTMTDKATLGNQYILTLPRMRLQPPADTMNGDDLLTRQFNFSALLDATANTELKLQRVSA